MYQNESIGYLISVLYRKNQIYLNQALRPYDLSPAEMLVLHRLCTHGECSQEEIAAHMMIDKAAITRTVQALEKKGWLTRQKNESDKRMIILKPLQKAYDAQEDFLDIMKYWTSFLTEGLETQKAEDFLKILTSMQELVKNTDLQTINEKRLSRHSTDLSLQNIQLNKRRK
ncbi:MAG: MarR family transcriptional regulator [Butyrivibrio sp.]|jgi:DNA-binding MarR family transcriptional regulator|nr:MarR family transcriptional regulator [Butyrivibrio sp.]